MKSILQNTRKPTGFWGRAILRGMNAGHAQLADWGLSHLSPAPGARVLDIGCGGGANIEKLLSLCPNGFVDGVDYSEESVKMSRKKNAAALGKRCEVVQGNVMALPYEDGLFDVVTAFETVYFWPDLSVAFLQVHRVLEPGGVFLLVCEESNPENTAWTDRIDGMKIYSGDDLENRLRSAGFTDIVAHQQKKGWLCLSARS